MLDYAVKDTLEYRRSLNLNKGICSTEFIGDGVFYRQEVFASAPDNVIVVRLSASRTGALDVDVCFDRERDARFHLRGNEIVMEGQVVDEDNELAGIITSKEICCCSAYIASWRKTCQQGQRYGHRGCRRGCSAFYGSYGL